MEDEMASEQIGICALQLDRRLDDLPVVFYRLVSSCDAEDENPVKITRRGAACLRRSNANVPMTDLGAWKLVALHPLQAAEGEWDGQHFSAEDPTQGALHAADPDEREALRRLLNVALYEGVRATLDAGTDRKSRQVVYGLGHSVEIIDSVPSERVRLPRDAYLEVFKTVRLTPEVLPDGTGIVFFHIQHRLMPKDYVTLEWVIRHRPHWLGGIRRVRHRYRENGREEATAELLGIAEENALSTFSGPQGEISYFEYHRLRGRIRENELEEVRRSSVVRLRYPGGNSKPKEWKHLAALLRPLFDFETLQEIDGELLGSIAKRLPWSVDERLRTISEFLQGIEVPQFGARLVPLAEMQASVRRWCPDIRLRVGKSRLATSEQAVLTHGAYRPMKKKRIVFVTIGTPSQRSEEHFSQVLERCRHWCGGGIEGQVAPPATDAQELDLRLERRCPKDAVLLVGLAAGADKRSVRDVLFRHALPVQFMRLDHPPKRYTSSYYNNLAAGVFSKGGGVLCAIEDMPGEADLFLGLDLGGIHQRVPGFAFLFTRDGAQLGWQLAEAQSGERIADESLRLLLERSLEAYRKVHGGEGPRRIVLHRDGRWYESFEVIGSFEQRHGIGIDVLEVIKSGVPVLYRRFRDQDTGRKRFCNPGVGDAFELSGLDEAILSTYSGAELGKDWGGKVTVRPLRLRKRYGDTPLEILAQQVVLLSRIHGASLYRHPRLPVTTHHADRFASLRRECNIDDLSRMDRLCPVYL